MAKVRNNALLYGASGKIGALVIRQTRNGTVLAKAPSKSKSARKKSPGGSARFASAVYYAREQMKNAETKALYQSRVNHKLTSAYIVAIADYLSAPVIDNIDATGYLAAAGQSIKVYARDDFRVTSVMVVIRNGAGEVVEQGAAIQSSYRPDRWDYLSTAINPSLQGCTIEACAKDLAGNRTSRTMTM
jgi:hypothetical protein